MIEQTTTTTLTCKNCGSPAIVKFGTYKGAQRYFCKVCNRKFKADDTLFHMKTPANQVSSALNMYYEGMSIKAIRRQLQQEHSHSPSTATIYEWIQKYTQYALGSAKDYQPKVGNEWVADETVIKIDGQNVWLWDIIDEDTRYLLATRISTVRTTGDAQTLIDRAIKTAGKSPKIVYTDKLAAYLDVDYGKDAEHKHHSLFDIGNNANLIERFHSTFKSRTKVMRGLKNIETAKDFTQGWLLHYNYLRPHYSLDDKTPAEVAGIDYPYKNWADITRIKTPPVKIQISHVPRGTLKLPSTRYGKRRGRAQVQITPKRPRLPRGDVYVGRGMLSRHPFKGGQARKGRIL